MNRKSKHARLLELGKDVLTVKDVSVTVDGVRLLDKVYFSVNRGTDRLVGETSWRRPPCSRSSPARWSPTRAL